MCAKGKGAVAVQCMGCRQKVEQMVHKFGQVTCPEAELYLTAVAAAVVMVVAVLPGDSDGRKM